VDECLRRVFWQLICRTISSFSSIEETATKGKNISTWLKATADLTRVAYLDQILALGLGNKRLELGSGEGINEARLGDDQKENLSACQDR
jgi:hypothetical protein